MEINSSNDQIDQDKMTNWMCCEFKHYPNGFVICMQIILVLLLLGLNVSKEVKIFMECEQHDKYIAEAIKQINDCRTDSNTSQLLMEYLQGNVS